MSERPILHALVAYFVPPQTFVSKPKLVTLEEAEAYHRYGWVVLVDPADERDLAMYERWQRAVKRLWTP